MTTRKTKINSAFKLADVTIVTDAKGIHDLFTPRTLNLVEVPPAECQSSICISGGPCPEDALRFDRTMRLCHECAEDFGAAQAVFPIKINAAKKASGA